MSNRAIRLLGILLVLCTILLFAVLYFSAAVWFRIPAINKISSVSVGEENLLVLSIRVNEASSSLRKKIEDANLNLPPVVIYDSDLSYRTPGTRRSWILPDKDNGLITIVIYRDVLSSLNSDEIQAFALHDLGHFILNHPSGPLTRRNVSMEEEADKFAIDSGIDPKVLTSAINKLVRDSDEKQERLRLINNYSSDQH